MAILSSRQPAPTGPSHQAVVKAAQPAVNIVLWLTGLLKFVDDQPVTIRGAQEIIEDALDCLDLVDFTVMSVPGPNTQFLFFEIAVKPIDGGPFVFFRAQFIIL